MSQAINGFMIRKINRAKWQGSQTLNLPNDISSDAITLCLKTSSNTLSVWNYDKEFDISNPSPNDLEELKKFGVACTMSASTIERASTIDLVFIQVSLLQEFSLEKNTGDSFFLDLENLHFDLHVENFHKLGQFASIVCKTQAQHSIYCVRVTKSEVVKILKDKIAQGNINVSKKNINI